MIILKRNLEKRHVKIINWVDNPKEFVVVDLRVGDRYRVPGKSRWFDLKKPYLLRPGRCALIRTEEKVQLPENVFASIFSRGGLSAKGLIVSNTKIDPLFSDYLNIPVFNAGKQTIRLERGDRFCSVAFYLLEQPIDSTLSRDPIDMGATEQSFFIDVLYEYLPHLIAAIISIVGAAVATYITIKVTPSPEAPQSRIEQKYFKQSSIQK